MLKKVLKDNSHGELVVVGKNFTKSLYFQEGHLVFAKTDLIEERLGEILFKIGKINRQQFNGISDMIKDRSEKMGKIMVEHNILSQRDLFFALLYQMRTIATSTFSLVSGEWNFIPKVPQVPEDSRFKIGLPGIITEGTNKITNISYFKNKFFYKAPKVIPIPASINEFLSKFETDFHNNLEKMNNLSNEKIFNRLKMPEETFWKKMILFYLLNIVDFADVVVDKDLDKNVEEIIRLYEQLKINRLDYYQLLAVKNTSTLNDIKNAYFAFAKKYHPDRISNAPDPDIKEKANYVFAEINKAYETLSNTDKRREYDSKGYKENDVQDAIHENLSEKARLLYRRAKAMYAQKKFWEASSTMDEAVRLDPKRASYFLLLGMCQMNLPKLKRMAANSLQKAIDLEPWNVEAHAAMGILFLSENQTKRAEGFFRKVLSFNPDHTLARKKLDEIAGSSSGTRKKSMFNIFSKTKK
jgi:curved DNA-binding protein CbpA